MTYLIWSLWAILGAAVILVVMLRIAYPTPQRVSNWRGEDGTAGAYAATIREVTARLSTPATADFPWSPERCKADVFNQSYVIVSYVDAENLFGANVRHRFAARVRQTSEDVWQVEQLEFE